MSQHMQSSSEVIIFVTHVEAENLYLKVWGQLDKQAATCVERQIYPLIDQFNQGYGCPSKTNRLMIGALCCARFQADGYYRAKILNVRPDGMIVVQFIDYGNVEIVPPNEVHLLDNIPGSENLRSYAPMAAEFTLLNVLPINGIWENTTIEAIRKILCYNEYRALIYTMNNRGLIKLWYNNEDFSELLVRERMALPATAQDMFRPKPALHLQMPQHPQMPQHSQMPQHPQMPVYQQQNKSNVNNFTTMPMMQNPNMNQNSNMQGLFHKTPSPGISQHKHAVQSPPPPVQEALVFKSRVLDVGSDHEVLVSYVEDGPQKFSVQVENTRDILTHLMNEINNRPKQPLQEPPLPGSVCLGRYTGDGVLCRAVVMSVMEHKCKLYYVDFGHTEVLPYTDIFQLPSEYINPKVLSIRFTLSGLKELNITQEMKDFFKTLVWRKLLILRVRSPEGPPLIQYGDLYENGVNVKDILKKAFPAPATAVPIIYSYPQLKRLSKDVQEVIQVSYVESCKKFFVQLDNEIKSLESIMAGLEQYVKTAPALNIEQIKIGLPCAALYDLQWYRARILNITGDQVKVVYVDYGNEEVLPITSLRTIHADLITKLPAQAIRCALNGYEALSSDQEVSNHFEKLILEKRCYMKVIAAQPNGLLVDLFEFDTMKNIHPQLLNNLFYDKSNNSASSRNEEIQYSTMTTNDSPNEDKDRYSKKNNTNSWNHNQKAKSFQDNKPDHWKDEWSEEKRHDNRRERTGNHSHYDGSQNDRFPRDETMNNRFNKDRSYNKYDNKYDRNEINTFNKSDRAGYQNGNKFGNERRYNRNNPTDKPYNNDKELDTSTKNNYRRGKGDHNDFNNSRGKNYDGGISGRLQTTNLNDKKPWANHKNNRSNGDYSTSNNKFNKDKEYNASNESHDQINIGGSESWGNTKTGISLQNNVAVNGGFQLSSINIVFDHPRNCEVVFINSPLDFFIQLSPDCFELDAVMENIATAYENDGEIMQTFKIQSGVFCVAQYSEDLKWYRAVIKSVEDNSATVEFVDYGNTESVDFTKIKEIREEFLKLPMQAIHCKLFGLMNTDNRENLHAIFSEQVEGKLLEVEFTTEENGIYEILLREIINNVPSTNSINEICGVDLTKTKETATCKTTKTEIQVPDYTSFDTKWQMVPYEAESKHDVIVTWLINPNKLYCQSLAREAEFKAMMNEIQKTYASRESIKHKLAIGSIVIAIFSEDRALYRAEVVSNATQKDAYIVQYIDFGNCTIVNQRDIYAVEKKFTQLPRLAMQCTLKNIIPYNDSKWSKMNNNAFDTCFNAEKYECIFHNFNNNEYTISLIHNGQDVGKMLVERNLAAFATKTPTETIGATETLNDATNSTEALNNVERVDISLLSGQTLKMRVSNVEDTTRFYVQFPSASKCENIVNQYMTQKNTEVMPRLSTREICLGAGCLVNVNGIWRRAVVINCSRSLGFDIKLIDTGEYNEILDSALALPGELAVMQNQALECCLQNVPVSSDADKQLKELQGKEVLVYVEEISNNRLIVKLYDLLGNGILSMEEEDKPISPVCPMPILSSTHDVSVSYAEHSASIWLQRYSDLDIETKLLEDLEQYYEQHKSGQRLKPEMHMLCAAKCSDGRWYRAKIINCTESTAYVHYIDYGNIEVVTLESIMVLEPRFYEPHQLAVNVSLSVTLAGTENEQINVLQLHLMNKDLGAVFYNVHKKWIVDLIENGEKLSEKLRTLNLVKEEQTTVEPLSQTHETSTTNKFNVCVSHVDSPSQFWLQRADEITSLNEKQEQLQLEISDFPTIQGIPEEGALCVAIYSIDNLWYRAEVLDADEDITTVRFIDYGNTDVIDNKTGNIRQIPDSWKNLERSALKCRLDVVPVDMEDWNEPICERFENLVTSTDIVQAVILADTMPKRIELFVNDKSVSETLVQEKHAIIINTEQEPVDEIIDLELDPHSAFVSHINSPNEFWIQEEKLVADLEVMADRFIVADMFPKIDDVKEGLLCVAKYPEDEKWYRARVVSHDDNGTQVIYIDYGNSAVSIDIRVIPEDLAAISPLSRKCCLELPPQIKEWSKQAREEFIKLSADGATTFLLDVLKEQETSLVKLTLDGQNVVDILAGMCEQLDNNLPVIEERLPPLGEENSPNVVVSHINSPSEFWIQTESSINELEVMSDRLRDAESFLMLNSFDIGTICAARYPEDGYWYRAKIVTRCEDSSEALYMDYGNSAITTELRVLPEDIANIPILSKRCALQKPSCVTTWSEIACNKFKELAAEGATMFQFKTVDENDPMYIQLSLNGTNVVDLLLAECENIPEIGDASEEIKITSNAENQEIVHENHQLSEEISDLNEEIQQESTFNQIKVLENKTDNETLNNSFDNFNTNEEYQYVGKPEKYYILNLRSSENINENLTTTTVGFTDNKIKEVEVSTSADTSDTSVQYIEPVVKELTVDQIVESMRRDSNEDLESQKINDTNLLDTNETQSQFVIQTDTNEQTELLSQMESIDINKSKDTQNLELTSIDENISNNVMKPVIDDSNSKEILSEVDVSQSQDSTQFDITEIKEKEACPEILLDKDESLKSQNSTKDETISGSMNNILEIQSKSTSMDHNNDSNSFSSESTCTIKATESPQFTIKTEQCSYSRKHSVDKIVPGCVSRGESDPEPVRPATPKTPHSEKLVAGAVNPSLDSIHNNEEDEILTVSVEENIPKFV